jgi:RHS repeat-associated protein
LRENEEMNYTANNLNQYTQRTIPDGIDVLGSAETDTTVTVNDLATTRHGKYWYRALTVTNSSSAAYHEVNVVGVYNPPGTNDPDVVTVQSGKVFVAKTPEAFTYDDDGNLLSDGRFSYVWDAENRLIGAETLSTLPSSVPRVKLEFAYDYMSRRVSKKVYKYESEIWNLQSEMRFAYDGWNLIREITTTPIPPYSVTNSYVWGLDLSGTLQGAGGIGGLLAARLGTNNVCYTYDANGNVSELLQSTAYSPQSILAHYEYSPFGETIVATGPLAKENSFRFSTKYTDDESGLLYYGYRYYSPSLGRWLARDPIGEVGGLSLYGAVFNNPIQHIDPNGQAVFCTWRLVSQRRSETT